jgi:hypothetical protein
MRGSVTFKVVEHEQHQSTTAAIDDMPPTLPSHSVHFDSSEQGHNHHVVLTTVIELLTS